jgi:hypothetical protein
MDPARNEFMAGSHPFRIFSSKNRKKWGAPSQCFRAVSIRPVLTFEKPSQKSGSQFLPWNHDYEISRFHEL